MKSSKLIFIFLFLSGMLFTVFQYIPILEEESHGHKIELAKKVQSNENGDGANDLDNDDCDDDSESDSYLLSQFHLNVLHLSSIDHIRRADFIYSFQLNSIQVPPPKV